MPHSVAYLFIYLFDQGPSRRSDFSRVGFQVGSHFTYTTRNPKNLSIETAEIFIIFSNLSLEFPYLEASKYQEQYEILKNCPCNLFLIELKLCAAQKSETLDNTYKEHNSQTGGVQEKSHSSSIGKSCLTGLFKFSEASSTMWVALISLI